MTSSSWAIHSCGDRASRSSSASATCCRRKLRQADPKANVYSLGIIGVGLKDYVKSVKDVPQGSRARRLIVAFYQNDMPPMDTLDGWMERLSLAVGRSSVSARLLLDMVRLSFAPNVDQYAKALLDNYEEDGIDFPARWQTLVAYFKSLYELSAGRSVGKPILVVIPALSGSDREKWLSAHRRVARAAADAGFERVGPVFRLQGRDARNLAVSPRAERPSFQHRRQPPGGRQAVRSVEGWRYWPLTLNPTFAADVMKSAQPAAALRSASCRSAA